MTTFNQIEANRANSRWSTGPATKAGKAVVSGNRIVHGVLSTRLLLADESAEEYSALLAGLEAYLAPVGTLEVALVEKIASIIWRQRRLMAAESSSVTLAMHPQRVADEVSAGLGIGELSSDAVKPADFEAPDPEEVAWCQTVVDEYEAWQGGSVDALAAVCPKVHEQLIGDAGGVESVDEFLRSNSRQGLDGYLAELVRWCRAFLRKAERHDQIQALAVHARQKLSLPWGRLDLLNRYHVALDNQLYKALRALRDAQRWRLNAVPLEVGGEVMSRAEPGSA